MRSPLALLVLAGGCYAAPPPPALPSELGGCHPGAYATLSEHPCARDADCLLCGTEDGCALVPRSRVELTGEPCAAPSTTTCEARRAACCEGRCVESLGSPFR